MKILLLGATGQLGWQLQRSLGTVGEIIALSASSTEHCGDLRDAAGLRRTIADVQPQVVVNAAAYTDVDRAEDDPAAAFAINGEACRTLAEATAALNVWLVHYSTEHVYDGSGDQPWREGDPARPLNAYGRSKLAGDQAIVAGNPRHLILRTSWIFEHWGRNFVRSILERAAHQASVDVVSDQWGAPTRAALVADVTACALHRLRQAPAPQALAGVYHLAAAGVTSRHACATLVVEEALRSGLALRAQPDRITAVPSSAFPVRAVRPQNSRLDTARLQATFGVHLPPWQDGVRAVVAEIARQRAFPMA